MILKFNNDIFTLYQNDKQIKKFNKGIKPYNICDYINNCVDLNENIITNSYLMFNTIKDRCNNEVIFNQKTFK